MSFICVQMCVLIKVDDKRLWYKKMEACLMRKNRGMWRIGDGSILVLLLPILLLYKYEGILCV